MKWRIAIVRNPDVSEIVHYPGTRWQHSRYDLHGKLLACGTYFGDSCVVSTDIAEVTCGRCRRIPHVAGSVTNERAA